MSVKVFNGILLEVDDLAGLSKLTSGMIASVESVTQVLVAKHIAVRASRIVDAARLNVNDPEPVRDDESTRKFCYDGQNPLSQAWSELEAAHHRIKSTGMRDPSRDFTFSASFALLPNGKVVGRYLTEHEEIDKAVLGISGVRSYSYFNSEDKPDEIPEPEWDERKADWNLWDKATKFQVGFGEHGVDHIPKEDIAKHVPPLDERVKFWARRMAFDKKFPDYAPKGGEAAISSYVHAVDLTREFLATPEGERIEEAFAKRVRASLGKPLSMEDITAKPLRLEGRVGGSKSDGSPACKTI